MKERYLEKTKKKLLLFKAGTFLGTEQNFHPKDKLLKKVNGKDPFEESKCLKNSICLNSLYEDVFFIISGNV